MFTLKRIQQLPISIKEAWEFFSNPKNLASITPSKLKFEILTDLPAEIYNGLIVAYHVCPIAGIPMKWVSEIKDVRTGVTFTDDQRIGPYKLWHHQHNFRSIEGGVEMEDIINYALPWGALGSLAHEMFVKKDLEHIFAYRRNKLDSLFGKYKQPERIKK